MRFMPNKKCPLCGSYVQLLELKDASGAVLYYMQCANNRCCNNLFKLRATIAEEEWDKKAKDQKFDMDHECDYPYYDKEWDVMQD